MKFLLKHLALALILFTMTTASFAGVVNSGGATRSLTIGGRTFNDAEVAALESNGVSGATLTAFTTTAGNYSSFRLQNGTTGWAIPASKTAKCLAAKMAFQTSAANFAWTPGYGDDNKEDTGAPANPVYLAGRSSSVNGLGAYGTNFNPVEWSMYFTIPTGKIPFMHSTVGANMFVTMYCLLY